ncbi:hypothetical protein ABH944_007877 [Caballeronia udeis]|uniref:Uncharacterized protein n=1 Tax=Caballeronia udeis TaxID=1232866 RepID=A0ABW8MVE2_9BURK|nr:hypothetical protein [Caballeronia udeis]
MTRWNDTKLRREARPVVESVSDPGLALMQAFDISRHFPFYAHEERAVQKQNACISKLTQAFRCER